MAFIDWSDSEGMFGLLLDFIADQRAECQQDAERHQFMTELFAQLKGVEARLATIPASAVIQRLRDVHESVGRGFMDDPAMVHLQDCIEELEKVEDGAA